MIRKYDGIKICCPECGTELIIRFDCAFCDCGWSIDDVGLAEVIGEKDNYNYYDEVLRDILTRVSTIRGKRQELIIYEKWAQATVDMAQGYVDSGIYKDQDFMLIAVGGYLDNLAAIHGIIRKDMEPDEELRKRIRDSRRQIIRDK